MSSYNRSDLEKIAAKIIVIHSSTGKDPLEALTDTCSSKDMNEEQIKRLVEMTNTGLFLDKFKGTSGGKNRFIDFNVIDPMQAIKSIMGRMGGSLLGNPSVKSHKSMTISISTPKGTSVRRIVDNEPGLDDDKSWFFDDVPNQKVASFKEVPLDYDVEPMEKVANATSETSPFNDAKMRDTLLTKKAEAEIYCDELSTKIASMYKDMYSRQKYASYEQDALSIFGPEATYALQAVRSKLGMSLLRKLPDGDMVKKASDRYISDVNTPGIVETGFFLENLKSHIKVSNALGLTKTAAMGVDAAATMGTALIGKDFLAPISSATGYQLATKYGPSAFYRVKGYDRMMEQVIDKGMDKAFGLGDKLLDDMKSGYNARVWRKNRLKAVKNILQDPDIAGADKERVREAVQSISKYAPKTSQDPAMLRGLVKQMIFSESNAIDPQTISELIKAEKRFRELDSKSPVNPWS